MLLLAIFVFNMLLTIGHTADGTVKCASSNCVAHFTSSSRTFESTITDSHSTISSFVSFNRKVAGSKKFDPTISVSTKTDSKLFDVSSEIVAGSLSIDPTPTSTNTYPTEFSSSNNGTNIRVSPSSCNDTTIVVPDTLNITNGFLSCSNITLEPADYDLLQNGSIYVKTHNLLLNKSFYSLESNTISICKPETKEKVTTVEYLKLTSDRQWACLSFVGLLISGLALYSRLLFFWFVDDYGNSGFISTAFVGPLLFVFNLIVYLLHFDKVSNHQNLWLTLPALSHFFMLALYSWMSVMSSDMFVLRPMICWILRFSNYKTYLKPCQFKTLWINMIATFFFLIYMTLAAVVNIVSPYIFTVSEPGEFCWLSLKKPPMAYLGGQVLIFIIFNIFIYVANMLHSENTSFSNNKLSELCLKVRENYCTCFKLSIATYVTWFVGALATIPSMRWMWYAFVTLHVFELGIAFFLFVKIFDELSFENVVYFVLSNKTRPMPDNELHR